MGKGILSINDRLVKGQALTLVNGNSPGEFEGDLLILADHLLFNLFVLLINIIFDVFPTDWADFNLFAV